MAIYDYSSASLEREASCMKYPLCSKNSYSAARCMHWKRHSDVASKLTFLRRLALQGRTVVISVKVHTPCSL